MSDSVQDRNFNQKLNSGKVVNELPDATEILKTGDMSWIDPMLNNQRYDFIDNFMNSDIPHDLEYIIGNDFDKSDTSKQDKNSKAMKAIKIL